MPELPEVETVMRGLAPVLEGARLTRVEQRRAELRFPLPERFAERLQGRQVQRLQRRGKYILAHLDDGEVLIIHLGMTGRFSIEEGANGRTPGQFVHSAGHDPRHDHILLTLSTGTVVRYNDARRFGYMDLVPVDELASHKLMKGLGVEPLGEALTADWLAKACAQKKVVLKAALMDQRIIAGLGNIYVCEALHQAALDPRRAAATLATKAGAASVRCERLVEGIRRVLGEAIEAGGSSLRDFEKTDGSLGYFQHSFAVYDREGQSCRRSGCGGAIRRIVQTGRSTFYCPRCQR